MKSLPQSIEPVVENLLGFINLSSGAFNPTFYQNLNILFDYATTTSDPESRPVYARVFQLLKDGLANSRDQSQVLKDCRQVEQALSLCHQHLLPAYLNFHSNVLFHQNDDFLFNSFFVGRALETILQNDFLDAQPDLLIPKLIRQFNDYVGHRPLAALETHKMEPYAHEWIRPIPLYLQNVGPAIGPYQELIRHAIELIQNCDPGILRAAQFELDMLSELSLDPRSLDFDHPVNRRPNHHFGQWDEGTVDDGGNFRRFIVHQVTLDAMLARIEETDGIDRSELLIEGGAVLACTMLMGSGISGRGPGAYDSNMTLGKLVPLIAQYRDRFYNDLILQLPEAHQNRLMNEAVERHQPFGAARQDINNRLSQQRDRQLIHCRLAQAYARMGYRDAAIAESEIVPVASARINAQIDCLLNLARRLITNGKLVEATDILPQISEQLLVGIDCGAIVDPWNILGFDGNYSLFPASENSIRDHRVDDLVELMNQILSVYSQLWTFAAAADRIDLCDRIRFGFRAFVDWWRQFGAHEVMSVDAVDPEDVYHGAEHVSRALNLWHRGGAAAGDLEFWSQHAQMFDSPAAYRLVIEALLDRNDFKTSRALMIHWLSQNGEIELQQGDNSFYDLMWRWISAQRELATHDEPSTTEETWIRIQKFYDYLEANGGPYWQVPDFQVGGRVSPSPTNEDPFDDDGGDELSEFGPSSDDVLKAAYEDMIYADETDDGFEGSVFDGEDHLESALEMEVDRVVDRLDFLGAIAEFWRISARFPLGVEPDQLGNPSRVLDEKCKDLNQRKQIYLAWLAQASRFRDQLYELLDSVHSYALPTSGVDSESLLAYDRHRLYKESLTQEIISVCTQFENAIRMLASVILGIDRVFASESSVSNLDDAKDQRPMVEIFAAALTLDRTRIADEFPALNDFLRNSRLLYVPLSRGGSPREIVQFRTVQSSIRELLATLPFLGLMTESYELTQMSMTLERNMPIDQGAVTEFDELFGVAYSAMVEAIVLAAKNDKPRAKKKKRTDVEQDELQRHRDRLFRCIEDLTESMLIIWLAHSQTLRLSVLERVMGRHEWQPLVKFISSYGGDLFSQEFLQLSNVRAILHQGVDEWLYKMQQSHLPHLPKLIKAIGETVTLRQAVDYLTLILEAIIENYPRYRDYNGTTTLSDRGEMLYVLLDFLRLERRYDRISWHLKPVVWAHEILVRNGEPDVARDWRRSLVERVGPEAGRYLAQMTRLRKKYSIQMASIGQHLEGRFVKPMLIDRLVAMVPEAMQEPDSAESRETFDMLKFECDTMSRMSAGVGIDVPDWLQALEEEIDKQTMPERFQYDPANPKPLIQALGMDLEQLIEQVESFPKHGDEGNE
ncbi:MAG: hypothetical protein R3C03_07490 [Pirellulaceae bacterium]